MVTNSFHGNKVSEKLGIVPHLEAAVATIEMIFLWVDNIAIVCTFAANYCRFETYHFYFWKNCTQV